MDTRFVKDGRLSEEGKAELQGFATSGYGHLPHVAYVLVQFHDPASARRWIGELIPHITTASGWRKTPEGAKLKPDQAMNVAFTHQGFAALGLSSTTLCSFPPAFREGMAEPSRAQHVLGDTQEGAPENWEFGGPGTPPVHACLMLHAASEAILDVALASHLDVLDSLRGGVELIPAGLQRGYRPENGKEHFGFRDGIAQPDIVGIKGNAGPEVLPTGDFILGYPDHYGMVQSGPIASADDDVSNALPDSANPFHGAHHLRDLGLHGTYLVYRKIEQDVASFWGFVRRESEALRTATGTGDAVWVAAKMMGRWPGGAPLVLAPDRDDPALATADSFAYAGEDSDGLRCPFGSHIRRSNPRDLIRPSEKEQSANMSRAHRIRRQGSIYGPQLDFSSPDGSPQTGGEPDGAEHRGLHFMAVNANIERQFELIQQQWMNNPAFNGLSESPDPVAGGGREGSDSEGGRMVIPMENGTWCTRHLPHFTTVRGGAYLFLPGLRALRFLSALR